MPEENHYNSSTSLSPSLERAVQTNPVKLNQICHHSRPEPACSKEVLQKPEFSNPTPFLTLEQVAQPAWSCHPHPSLPRDQDLLKKPSLFGWRAGRQQHLVFTCSFPVNPEGRMQGV